MDTTFGFLNGTTVYRATLPGGFTDKYVATTTVGVLGTFNACSFLPDAMLDPEASGFVATSRVTADYPVTIYRKEDGELSQTMVRWHLPIGDIAMAAQDTIAENPAFVEGLLAGCRPYLTGAGVVRLELDSPAYRGDVRIPVQRDQVSLVASDTFPFSISMFDAGAFASSADRANSDFVESCLARTDGVVIRCTARAEDATLTEAADMAKRVFASIT